MRGVNPIRSDGVRPGMRVRLKIGARASPTRQNLAMKTRFMVPVVDSGVREHQGFVGV